jgi:hypothetical protein
VAPVVVEQLVLMQIQIPVPEHLVRELEPQAVEPAQLVTQAVVLEQVPALMVAQVQVPQVLVAAPGLPGLEREHLVAVLVHLAPEHPVVEQLAQVLQVLIWVPQAVEPAQLVTQAVVLEQVLALMVAQVLELLVPETKEELVQEHKEAPELPEVVLREVPPQGRKEVLGLREEQALELPDLAQVDLMQIQILTIQVLEQALAHPVVEQVHPEPVLEHPVQAPQVLVAEQVQELELVPIKNQVLVLRKVQEVALTAVPELLAQEQGQVLVAEPAQVVVLEQVINQGKFRLILR